jgi:sigma-B regulation protein RsbU (phosphoserine phosphatase)
MMTAVGARDLPALMACYDADAVAVSPVFGEIRGVTPIAATWERLFTSFAHTSIQIADTLVDGDKLAVLSTLTTSDTTGRLFGALAKNQPISYMFVLLLTLRNGRIVRDERIYDSAGLLERLEKLRIDRELHTAADVQRALLPEPAHATPFSESAGHSIPCRAIGGDFFEFLPLPSGALGVAMGDVAGKGAPAALLAAMLQGMLISEAASGTTPADMLTRINHRLAGRCVNARYATLVYSVLFPDGRLVTSNAGHNPPVLRTGGNVRRLATGGPILGAFADAQFEQEHLDLSDGDELVMFTDGVTEARNAADEEFGDARLVECLANGDAPATSLRRIFDAVQAFGRGVDQLDDITATVTRYRRR